jgi:hypothetical protein
MYHREQRRVRGISPRCSDSANYALYRKMLVSGLRYLLGFGPQDLVERRIE